MRRTDERRTDEGHSRNELMATGSPKVRTLADEKEADPHRLAQRQKQIDYGKNTIGYDRYCAQVPRHARRPGRHPMTPDKTMRMGKKVFDGIVRKWRQALHKYDPPELTETIKIIKTEATAQELPSHCKSLKKQINVQAVHVPPDTSHQPNFRLSILLIARTN
ncbi:hypothetical protein BBO99_00001002 [Phytophthora kernoviae]|uniref:Histone RNA hairpin-binding protein RNA-binding domain-containing protein n=2 Tax=Phytophthora kernoviae TaxID=325452 RepID=A0A421FLB8_9STRA|nr:hypothetical protein G195_003597 [Phytophthora kernoviae 00238/432]KAG2529888.1 hypothetical protein JM16_001760 [Phytophthora kernoviae]KAG2531719.1 hypothetical protein JM18_000972 [Phytophthora kernoviae]RLN46480.1 hypothetical protein BBI17_000903 [Phytophthora kernoviae]RLN84876.1 hypothetical protein BBO99_00001002 [Phytophthora kernoviae]